jgi:hypothetical protein
MDMMYMIGPIPMENKQFLSVLELGEKRVENKRWDSKSGDKDPKNEENHKDKNKNRIKTEKANKEKNHKSNEGSKTQKED